MRVIEGGFQDHAGMIFTGKKRPCSRRPFSSRRAWNARSCSSISGGGSAMLSRSLMKTMKTMRVNVCERERRCLARGRSADSCSSHPGRGSRGCLAATVSVGDACSLSLHFHLPSRSLHADARSICSSVLRQNTASFPRTSTQMEMPNLPIPTPL